MGFSTKLQHCPGDRSGSKFSKKTTNSRRFKKTWFLVVHDSQMFGFFLEDYYCAARLIGTVAGVFRAHNQNCTDDGKKRNKF